MFTLLHPLHLPPPSYCYPSLDGTCFSFLSFFFFKYVLIVQGGFTLVFQISISCTLIGLTPSYTLSISHLGCFYFGNITKAITNIVYRFLYKSSFLWDTAPENKCTFFGSCLFSFSRNYKIVFQSYNSILHSYQQHRNGPFSPCPQKHLILSLFFYSQFHWSKVMSHLVFICIFLMLSVV
jgi:hypothetical protein